LSFPLTQQIEAVQSQSPYFSPKKTRNYIKLENDKTKDEKPNLKNLQVAVKQRSKKLVKVENDPMPGTSQSANADLIKDLAADQKFNIKTELGLDQIKQELEIDDIEAIPKFVPLNWQQTFENIRQMRASVAAPVDTMGCDKCSDNDYDEKVCLCLHSSKKSM
jgi:endonuclease III